MLPCPVCNKLFSFIGIYRHDNEQDEDDNRETLFTKQRQVNKLTDLLSNKLSEFLSSSFPYSLKRVPSTHVANLYKGSTAGNGDIC